MQETATVHEWQVLSYMEDTIKNRSPLTVVKEILNQNAVSVKQMEIALPEA